MRNQLQVQYKKYGLHVANDNETSSSRSEKLHKIRIINLACSFGLQECVTTAKGMLSKWMNSSDKQNR